MIRPRLILLLITLLVTATFASDPAFDLPSAWEGYIDTGGIGGAGRKGIQIIIDPDGGPEFGSIYYPLWGETTWPITHLKIDRDLIEFQFGPDQTSPGIFAATLTDNQSIRGTYTWNKKKYPFALGLPGTLDKPLRPRPQIPQFPFPYRQERVALKNGNVIISGLVLVPQKVRRYSAVVLIGGSEPRAADPGVPGDPDPNLWQWVLADYLARAGIVSLRMDSRGTGQSAGNYDQSTIEDLAADAAAAVEYLRTRPDINRRRVGLLGFSMGADIATMAANLGRSADFVVMLAGSGGPQDRLVMTREHLLAGNRNEAEWKRQREFWWRLYELCKSDMSSEQIAAELLNRRHLFDDPKLKPADSERLLRQRVAEATTPIFRSRLRHDPLVALRGLRQTVLVMAGEKDQFCPADLSIPAIQGALNEGINWSKSIKVWPGLSHSFTKTTTGLDATTDDIIEPDVLFHIADWIWQRPRRW